MPPKNPQPKPSTTGRLLPGKGGATVRMYRTGHGDCFLLAFAGEKKSEPVYVLIDCGYKPGSPAHIGTAIKDIAANIEAATGGRVDVAVITHEHQDHVNGFTAANFKNLAIDETWLAWTEDPADAVANDLRKKYKDKLLGLVAARQKLAAAGSAPGRVGAIDSFLEFELGAGNGPFNFNQAAAQLGAAAAGMSQNKLAMKLVKDRAKKGIRYLRAHEKILALPGAKDVRVFVLGPPRDPKALTDLDPQGDEEFHGPALAMASAGHYFAAAAAGHGQAPFARRYSLPKSQADQDPAHGPFFRDHYTGAGAVSSEETGGGADWRRIDDEWLYSAEELALAMNSYTNNASLVLAFELKKSGRVLLFAADAQRGNWISWARKDWSDGGKVVTARDLLGRVVLYKVGHHGSHNATLNGAADADHACLSWMGTSEHAHEFTAMITAVRAWAMDPKVLWNHPYPPIKKALLQKAAGRVLQTDLDPDLTKLAKPAATSKSDWDDFLRRARGELLFFDYDIAP